MSIAQTNNDNKTQLIITIKSITWQELSIVIYGTLLLFFDTDCARSVPQNTANKDIYG
jgi:hypothetical protein